MLAYRPNRLSAVSRESPVKGERDPLVRRELRYDLNAHLPADRVEDLLHRSLRRPEREQTLVDRQHKRGMAR